MKKNPVIAVDGFSSTGKSSISKYIAEKLGIIHMDTGALYRGITLFALRNCSNPDGTLNLKKLFSELPNIILDFKLINGKLCLFLNDENIEREIRNPMVSEYVSQIAKQAEVRAFLLQKQRDIARNGGVIMDGRDIGSVVLPDADYKFFLTASIDERTRRRYAELISLGETTNEEKVKENLIKRDKADSEREISPLKQAEDAILIDNTNINKVETANLMLSYINNLTKL